MRFTCCLNMAFTWQRLSGPWFVCMTLHRKALRPWLIISPMFFSRKRCARLWRCEDVMTSEGVTLTPFFWKIPCEKRDILMIHRRFQCGLGWNQVKYARIMITHVCFIAFTLGRSLGRCLNTRPNSLVFKQLHRDPANVNAWKNMCDLYIAKHETLLFPRVNEQAPVANDLCIKTGHGCKWFVHKSKS